MKKLLLSFLCICFSINYCLAEEFSLQKTAEHPTSGFYLEKDNIAVQESYVYITSNYGLDIYLENSNNDLILVTRLPLKNDTRAVEIKDNFAYVLSITSLSPSFTLYKIDVSNPLFPLVTDSVFAEVDCFCELEIYNDFITVTRGNVYVPDWNYYFYSTSNLELIQIMQTESHFMQISETLSMRRNQNNIFSLYDFNDPENIFEITQIDLGNSGIGEITRIHTIDSSFIECVSEQGLAFWDYSDINNWELLSNMNFSSTDLLHSYICSKDDIVFSPFTGFSFGIRSIDISTITEPTIIDSVLQNVGDYATSNTDIAIIPNSLLFGSFAHINRFTLNDGFFENYEKVYDNKLLWEGIIYEDYLYILFDNQMKIYNIENPQNIVCCDSLYNEHFLYGMTINSNLMALIDKIEEKIIIHDITNPLEPIILDEIDIASPLGSLYLSPDNENIYFLQSSPTDALYKYNISEPGNAYLEFIFNLMSDGSGFIYNDYFYFLKHNGSQDLQIYNGLESNEPELVATIENFAEEYPDAYMTNYEEYFKLNSTDIPDSTIFFKIVEPTEIEYAFTANEYIQGTYFIDNNFLFISSLFSNTCIYDLDEVSGTSTPIIKCEDYGTSAGCILYETNDAKYIFHLQYTGFTVYQLISQGTSTFVSNKLEQYNTSPNPFTSSTTISFTTKNPLVENQQIEIFNIKGQKVKTLQIAPTSSRTVSAVWNGKNEQGKPVAQGVYFYKVETEAETLVKKMVKVGN